MIQQPTEALPPAAAAKVRASPRDLLVDLALVAILAIGAWLRLTGVAWDENQHMHPDERFLSMVETSIRPPESLSQYFNTDESPLNPHNVGHGFFVYGTLPIFLVRFLAEWTNNAGYDQVTIVGRVVSALFDLCSIYLIYRLGAGLHRRRVGLLAALFYALSVLAIQHAHFFVVESFTTAFLLACMWFAVRVQQRGAWADYLLFGLSLGMAVASKISAAPVAAVLVLAGAAHVLDLPAEARPRAMGAALVRMVAAAGISSWLITQANIPGELGVLLEPLLDNKTLLMVAMMVLVVVVGTALDFTPTVLILTPVLMPLVKQAGIDPIYFGVLFIINNAIGLLTPPVGIVLNVVCGVARVSMSDVIRGVTPFLVAQVCVLFLLIVFPQLVMWPFRAFMGLPFQW